MHSRRSLTPAVGCARRLHVDSVCSSLPSRGAVNPSRAESKSAPAAETRPTRERRCRSVPCDGRAVQRLKADKARERVSMRPAKSKTCSAPCSTCVQPAERSMPFRTLDRTDRECRLLPVLPLRACAIGQCRVCVPRRVGTASLPLSARPTDAQLDRARSDSAVATQRERQQQQLQQQLQTTRRRRCVWT